MRREFDNYIDRVAGQWVETLTPKVAIPAGRVRSCPDSQVWSIDTTADIH